MIVGVFNDAEGDEPEVFVLLKVEVEVVTEASGVVVAEEVTE